MRRVQVFDVNETLLDLSGLDPLFERVFGDAGLRRVWFQQMIQSALVATVTGVYHQFGEIGAAALAMTAEQAGVELRAEDRTRSPLGCAGWRRTRRCRRRWSGCAPAGCDWPR
jgi:2-haloacid dehalogenase